jgi:hypothetical protein
MSELISWFPSTENLYKFLFIGGVLSLGFSFIYPMEKAQELELQLNGFKQNVQLLSVEINTLKEDYDQLVILTNETKSKLDSLSRKGNYSKLNSQMNNSINSYNSKYSAVNAKRQELRTKTIVLEYEKSRIELLQKHAKSFNIFRWFFFVLGFLSCGYGFYRWHKVTRMAEKKFEKECHSPIKD